MGKKKRVGWKSLAVILLLGTAGWAIYNFISRNAAEFLLSVGVTDVNIQDIVIIGACIALSAVMARRGWLTLFRQAAD